MLKPSLAMLDEIDSGLDVDAIKLVSDVIRKIQKETDMAIIIVSHYERFLELIKPTFTHVLINGKIVMSGDASLYDRIDKEGYDWIYKELNLDKEEEEKPDFSRVSLGNCAVAETMKGKN